ncbi:hypothetical protein AtDm6_2012 [Acetobacter tropicalis]|uniref:Uncharacterized protein n=1 Tax=Acetobacter tropicalis TaxID=104102 RepID=A0A094YN73_9PROT|nr:hypothetical protein AtDm6_2012 [Acetobacter tropicalis]
MLIIVGDVRRPESYTKASFYTPLWLMISARTLSALSGFHTWGVHKVSV